MAWVDHLEGGVGRDLGTVLLAGDTGSSVTSRE